VGVRGRLVATEGGVSYDKDERVFSEVSGVSGVACVSLRRDCAGWGGMIASLSLGGGAVDGDCRFDALPMEKTEMTQLVVSMSVSVYTRSESGHAHLKMAES
jgi:hypothetical protein